MLLLGLGRARADGAFPDEQQLFLPPGSAQMILATNVGLLLTDDGTTWDYVCEAHVAGGRLVYAYQLAPGGTLLAAGGDQVARSTDQGCTWALVDGGLPGAAYVVDLFADPTDGSRVAAIGRDQGGGSALFLSESGGAQFGPPALREPGRSLVGVEYSQAQPNLLDLTGTVALDDGGAVPFIAHRADGGPWSEALHPELAGATPLLAAADRADPATLYLRLVDPAYREVLAVSTDEGQHLTALLQPNEPLSAFLVAEDGSLYAGTRAGKLYVRPPATGQFVVRAAPRLRCLQERDGVLYGCGDPLLDGFVLARSTDQGQTFKPVLRFQDVRGPKACGTVPTDCAADWQRLRSLFAARDAGPSLGPPPEGPRGGCHCGQVDLGSGLLPLLGLLARGASRRRPRRD